MERSRLEPAAGSAGFTTVEVVVVALAIVVIVVAATFGLPTLARERVRGAVYDMQSMARLAHLEAAKRNRECRLLLDAATHRVLVVDGMGTGATSDDVVLHSTTLPSAVTFESPDGAPAITLEALGGSWFGATFAQNGTVETGAGSVVVRSQGRHGRLTLFAGGASGVAVWNGAGWSDRRH